MGADAAKSNPGSVIIVLDWFQETKEIAFTARIWPHIDILPALKDGDYVNLVAKYLLFIE